MNPVRAALYARLTGDAALGALLSAPNAVFHSVAPSDARAPFVVLNRQSGTPVWQFTALIENDLWQVKGIDRAPSASRAEEIAARIDVLLNDAALEVAGREHLYLRRDSDVEYSEAEGGELHWHAGALYRVFTSPA